MGKFQYDYGTAEHWSITFEKEFQKESDRAAVVLSAALIDNTLERLLKSFFRPITSCEDNLFEGPNAPLGDFSSRMLLCYRLGLISSSLFKDLNIIRKIRNDFAHNISECNFGSGMVKSRVLDLAKTSRVIEKFPEERKRYPQGTRGDFQYVVGWIIFHLNYTLEKETRAVNPPHIEPFYQDDFNEEEMKKKDSKK